MFGGLPEEYLQQWNITDDPRLVRDKMGVQLENVPLDQVSDQFRSIARDDETTRNIAGRLFEDAAKVHLEGPVRDKLRDAVRLYLATLFHHSNLYLPFWLERYLNEVVVTPRMHGIHHSRVREERNSNYSVIFRWWDYLQHTLYLCIPQSWIRIGLPGYDQPRATDRTPYF